jgi:hypothetical protein
MSIGFSCFILVLHTYKTVATLQSWSSVNGIVLGIYTQNASSPTTAAGNTWGKTLVRVKYQYFVGGKAYTNNKIMLLDYVYVPRKMLQVLKQRDVQVYYSVSNPKNSMLFIDSPIESMGLISVSGIILLLLGLFLPNILNFLLKALVRDG